VVEVKTLDSRRKLVLLRRDGYEHLVLLGPSQDLLVEGGIPAPKEDIQNIRPAVPNTRSQAT
jgi:flagellar protein FliO/FliZ